jgi:hypothetical protein
LEERLTQTRFTLFLFDTYIERNGIYNFTFDFE